VIRDDDLDCRIRIERKGAGAGFTRAGKEAWQEVGTVWAQVRDTLPSRSETTEDGLPMATGTARVRMRYRIGITSDMRLLVGRIVDGKWVTDRTMQIVGGPAEIGRREGLEMVAQDYSTAGGAA